MCGITRASISYEPVVGEEILFQPSNMNVEYVKELKTTYDIILHDFTIGKKSYWREKFDIVVDHIKSYEYRNGMNRYKLYSYLNSKKAIRYDFNRLRKEKKIKTKKDIIEYYRNIKLIKCNDMRVSYYMRKKKEELIEMYIFNKWYHSQYRLCKKLTKYYFTQDQLLHA